MAYEVRPDGTIIAPDEASALRLSRKIRAEAAREVSDSEAAQVAPPRRRAKSARRMSVREATQEKVATMFRVLASAGRSGMGSDQLAKEMGTKPKGIPPYAYAAKQMILETAPTLSGLAFWRVKTRGNGTTWYVDAEKLKEAGLM